MTSHLRATRLLDTGPPLRVADRADALLGRGGRSGFRPGLRAAAARAGLRQLLLRMRRDELMIIDVDGSVTSYGPDNAGAPGNAATRQNPDDRIHERQRATVRIADERAWIAVATEGSIGLGRGYIEGWWTTDDPTTVVQILIRNLGGLDEIRNRFERVTGGFGDRLRQAIPRPGRDRDRDRDHIAAHYDLGNDFFSLFLDASMTYSSAVFPSPNATLAEASTAKYDRLLAKLDVAAVHRVLEIGTGWGGFSIRAAGQAGCAVTTTTVSREQQREAEARVAAAGLDDHVDVIGSDWRDLGGRFHRIVSIEMIEAVDWRDYDRFFATLERCLEPNGLIGLQAICVPDQRYERAKNTEDFIRRFVFPGGLLPSLGTIGVVRWQRSTRLQVLDVEDFTAHYAETLRRWRSPVRRRRTDDDQPIWASTERFQRLWRFYLAYCEAGFLERHCTVNQLVLVRSGVAARRAVAPTPLSG